LTLHVSALAGHLQAGYTIFSASYLTLSKPEETLMALSESQRNPAAYRLNQRERERERERESAKERKVRITEASDGDALRADERFLRGTDSKLKSFI
jgi:hypothetical protein